jgi:hypothetical protein
MIDLAYRHARGGDPLQQFVERTLRHLERDVPRPADI